MNLYDLSFAKIIVLRDDIAEVIVNDRIEVNLEMVKQTHAFLLSHLKQPFSLLINKLNSYSYTFEAQMEITNLPEINVLAVVSYNNFSTVSTQYLQSLTRSNKWNLHIFSQRDEALAFLEKAQEKSLTQFDN
ncbi:hypothetical protein [Psychromonas aquimarina]|uniref:hypothetical protein n=1 Tax=Psychromonas aquimarina TaxID=444919 RepID=UPI000423B7F0|nr:hypothetical protein [Psychromonas aquimarina]